MKLNKRRLRLMIEQALHESAVDLKLKMEHPLLLKVKSVLEGVGLPVEINTGVQDTRHSVLIHVEYDTVYIEASFKHSPQVGLGLVPLTLEGHKFTAAPQIGFGVVLFTVV